MPILRHPSRSDIAAVPVDPLDESGVMPVSRRATVKITAVRVSAAPPPLPSLVVPPPASVRQPPPSAPQPPPSGGRPPPRSTVKMSAVRPDEGPPSGRMLDSVDFLDPVRVPLELGASPGRPPLQRPQTPPTAKTPAAAFSPVGTSSVVRKADSFDPRRPGIFAFAGFGLPPETLAGAPAYALRVLMRKRVLRQGLAVARRQRSVDIELYEAALRTADPDAYAKGLLALVAGPALALTLVVIAALLLT